MQKKKLENKPIFIVELNEFNVELLKQAIKENPLPSLERVFNFKQSSYKTNDRYNSGFLEPWVQWVSIHSGVDAKHHQIKHLGDVPDCRYQPFWQKLSKLGISTGVWGVMNGARLDSPHNQFFFPDPWTFTERAYPENLNDFLELPRYLAKNYRNLKKWTAFKKGLRLLKAVFKSGIAWQIIKQVWALKKQVKALGSHHYVYISWFDKLVTLLVCELNKTHQPEVTVLFLNSLAHLQHHHWTQKEATPQIVHGLKVIDEIFAILFDKFPKHQFIVHNGLSQMNTNHEKPWVLYRQKDPLSCLQALGLSPNRVEQHMTHDGHAFFDSPELAKQAYEKLKAIKIMRQPLFKVEMNQHSPTKLFYMLSFTDKLEKDAHFELEGQSIAFFELFDEIVTRTGRHIPLGTVFSSDLHFPDHIFNHEFNQYIYHYYLPVKYKVQAEFLEDEEYEVCAL